jgi:hypothetical protein
MVNFIKPRVTPKSWSREQGAEDAAKHIHQLEELELPI